MFKLFFQPVSLFFLPAVSFFFSFERAHYCVIGKIFFCGIEAVESAEWCGCLLACFACFRCLESSRVWRARVLSVLYVLSWFTCYLEWRAWHASKNWLRKMVRFVCLACFIKWRSWCVSWTRLDNKNFLLIQKLKNKVSNNKR